MLYKREIAGKVEIDDCKQIILYYDHPPLAKGQPVSNPSAELIAAEGWVEYIPPTPTPTPVPIPEPDPPMEELIEAVKKMLSKDVEALSDEDALSVAALFPTWNSMMDKEVKIGERYWYDERLWKVLLDHTVQESWTPDAATSLFVEVTIEQFPEWKQPLSAVDAYRLGDKVSHNDKHWESIIDYNTYEPGVYGWDEIA